MNNLDMEIIPEMLLQKHFYGKSIARNLINTFLLLRV